MVTNRAVKRLGFALGVLCVLLIGVASASAATTTRACGTSGTFTITDDWVVSQTNCAGAVTIPNTVTAIANYAFRDATMLTSVSFESPSNVAIVGAFSFYGASSLSSITIPTSVTDIGEGAFRAGAGSGGPGISRGPRISRGPGPSSLAKVSFDSPSKVTSIGATAFKDASSLESITIPGSVTSIGIAAFSTASRLASVYFEGSVAPAVGEFAFQSVATSATAYRVAGATGFDTVGSTPPLWNGLQVAEYLPAPKAPVAVAGVQLAEVTITPAAFGRAASSYQVTASPGGSVCDVPGASGSCTIAGLTAGVSYTFTAVARTTDPSLTSFASVASNAVVPTAVASSVAKPATPTKIRWILGTAITTQPIITIFIAPPMTIFTFTAILSQKPRHLQTRATKTTRGTCKITTNKKTKVRTAKCTIRLKKAGTWVLAITPVQNGVAGTPATKTIKIRAATKKTRMLLARRD